MDNCNNSKRSLNRSAGASLPSVNSAAFTNPAAISLSRGVGVETIHYDGYAQVGLVTGTGRVGAAISNFPSDGTFFGNTAIEIPNKYRLRLLDGKRFEEDKFILATGFNVFGGKQKEGLQMDVGLIYRRQTEKEKDYYGGGVTFTFNKIASVGFATYNDVYYDDLRGKKIYQVDDNGNITTNVYYSNDIYWFYDVEYKVTTVTGGLKFSKFAIDYIRFVTEFEDHSGNVDQFDIAEASIYNISYFYTTWIFSYGRRFEKSFKEIYEDDIFREKLHKSDTFLGAQYATANGFLLGGFYNYYLLNEISLGLTYFF